MRKRSQRKGPWSPRSATIAELDALDLRLATLGRGLGAMRLRIGEGLLRLEERDGIRKLGFPNLESYAREALGRSGRWGSDVRGLARRLAQLPKLRAALVSGRLSSSMVEMAARVATPELEATWVELAASKTIRQMRAYLKEDRNLSFDDDTTPPKAMIQTTVDRIDAWAFERTRLMVEALGATRGEGAIEAMLAEGLSEIIALNPDIDLPSTITDSAIAIDHRERAELALLREKAEAACESAIPPMEVEAVSELPAEIAWPDNAADVATLDAMLRAAARELARRDLELADLARRAVDHEIWRMLRYSSFDHYCRERIGMAPSTIESRIALADRIIELPEIDSAVLAGRIGYESAALVARIAGPGTVEAWLDRAEARTVKHLREEVEAIELLARADDRDPHRLRPPDDDLLADLHAVERAAIATITSQMSGGPAVTDSDPSQMSGGSSVTNSADPVALTKATLRFTVSDDTARFWRALERLHGQLAPGTSFVAFLVRATLRAWSSAIPNDVAYRQIYLRDRWRCASPICRSRSVTPHHIVFRSHGGGDEPTNVVSLCEVCHLELVHSRHLSVIGNPEYCLTWRAVGWEAYGRDARSPEWPARR